MAVNPETTVRKLVSLPRDLAAEIDTFRFDKRIKAESEAIRILIRAGLNAFRSDSSGISVHPRINTLPL